MINICLWICDCLGENCCYFVNRPLGGGRRRRREYGSTLKIFRDKSMRSDENVKQIKYFMEALGKPQNKFIFLMAASLRPYPPLLEVNGSGNFFQQIKKKL